MSKSIFLGVFIFLAFFSVPNPTHAAIAFDNASQGNSTSHPTSLTFSLAVGSGTNRILMVAFIVNRAGAPTISSVTYNGVAMTATSNSPNSTFQFLYVYYLANPASGTNNVVITLNSSIEIHACAASYTGAAQTGIPDAVATQTAGSGTSATLTATTIADNSWMFGIFRNDSAGNGSAGVGTIQRASMTGQASCDDSGAALTPPGSNSIQETWTGSATNYSLGLSFAPFVAPIIVTPGMRFIINGTKAVITNVGLFIQ